MQDFQGQHGTHIPRSAGKHAIPSTGNSPRFFGKNYLQPPAHGRVKMLVGGMVTCHTYCNHQLSTVNALLLVKSHSDPLRDKQIRGKKCLSQKNCSPKLVGQCGHFQGPNGTHDLLVPQESVGIISHGLVYMTAMMEVNETSLGDPWDGCSAVLGLPEIPLGEQYI